MVFLKIISTRYHFILTTVLYEWILDFLITNDQRNKTVGHNTKTVFFNTSQKSMHVKRVFLSV